jgi:hypothetical protein
VPASAGPGAVTASAAPATGTIDKDSDGDGLSDFVETHKHFTDPAKKDSDGDGTPDGDANERREYSYSIRTVVRVMKPYDLRAMKDDYQDARLLRETAEFGEIEVIHYPLNTVAQAIGTNANWQRDGAAMAEWLKPGITTNWTPEMREKLIAELRAAGIDPAAMNDRELAERVSRWMLDTCKSHNIFTTYYMDFAGGKPALLAGCETKFEGDKGDANWTFDEQLQHEVFGAGMFSNKTRGTCTSSAVYWTTIFRALGLPARHVLCIPAVDPNDDAQLEMIDRGITHHGVRKTMKNGMEKMKGFAAHTFNEVFVGGRWVRLNYTKLGQNILDERCFGLLTHTLTFGDLSEANLAATWGKRYAQGECSADLKTANPYTALEVSDAFGAHAQVPNPPIVPDREHKLLTIDRAYWLRSEERPGWLELKTFASAERTHVIALLHTAEWFEDQNWIQNRRFLDKTDFRFTLRAPGQEDVPATLTNGSFSTTTERAISLGIAKADHAKMKPGVAYQLIPANGKPEAQWAVKEGVALTVDARAPTVAGIEAKESTDALTISRVCWWHDLPPDDLRRRYATLNRDQTGMRYLLLHVEPTTQAKTVREFGPILQDADNTFFLVSAGENTRLPVTVNRNAIWGYDGGFELEIVLESKVYDALKPGTPYAIEARNKTEPHWTVSATAVVERR